MATLTQLNEILQQYGDKSFSQRDKGDRFERLMKSYLLTDKKYCDEFIAKDDLGGEKKIWKGCNKRRYILLCISLIA